MLGNGRPSLSRSTWPVPSAAFQNSPPRPPSRAEPNATRALSRVHSGMPSNLSSEVTCVSVSRARSQIHTSVLPASSMSTAIRVPSGDTRGCPYARGGAGIRSSSPSRSTQVNLVGLAGYFKSSVSNSGRFERDEIGCHVSGRQLAEVFPQKEKTYECGPRQSVAETVQRGADHDCGRSGAVHDCIHLFRPETGVTDQAAQVRRAARGAYIVGNETQGRQEPGRQRVTEGYHRVGEVIQCQQQPAARLEHPI